MLDGSGAEGIVGAEVGSAMPMLEPHTVRSVGMNSCANMRWSILIQRWTHVAFFIAAVENAYSISLILQMGVLSIPWCQVSMEPPMRSSTARCTVSNGVPVAVAIPSAITLMDWLHI